MSLSFWLCLDPTFFKLHRWTPRQLDPWSPAWSLDRHPFGGFATGGNVGFSSGCGDQQGVAVAGAVNIWDSWDYCGKANAANVSRSHKNCDFGDDYWAIGFTTLFWGLFFSISMEWSELTRNTLPRMIPIEQHVFQDERSGLGYLFLISLVFVRFVIICYIWFFWH